LENYFIDYIKKMANTLISFGKGYSIFGAVITTIIGAALIMAGRTIVVNPDTSVTKKYLIPIGVFIIAAGLILAYLAQKYEPVAMIYGVFFVFAVISAIVGIFIPHKAKDE